jgi:hypothetical protein
MFDGYFENRLPLDHCLNSGLGHFDLVECAFWGVLAKVPQMSSCIDSVVLNLEQLVTVLDAEVNKN